MKTYYVYIMSNQKRTVLYIGVTNNLERRVYEHKQKKIKGFTQKYNCIDLLFFEETSDIIAAIEREKQLKGWKRIKKDELVISNNPRLKDLSFGWYEEILPLSG